ncbi:MAG TPA: urate oxidase [Candidatus Eisenbacteria bacterium]|nr:urate oxidase [Candidatus Eisenbacteria bacterium]
MTSDDSTGFELSSSSYGKSRIRLVTVRRRAEAHDVRDLTLDVALEGDFEAVHTQGDNANVIATDTVKNTVYALAKDHLAGAPEVLGLALGRHFAAYPQVERATITLRQHPWSRIPAGGRDAPDAFVRSGESTRIATISVGRSGPPGAGAAAAEPGDGTVTEAAGLVATVEAGIEDLTVLKTAKSAFTGFDRDRFTTLADADDRLMATRLTATWGYAGGAPETSFRFDTAFDRLRSTLLAVFADHFSPSVQASIWIMGKAMLEAEPSVEWVRMILPNLHHWTVDLARFGLENPGEVFVATTEPHGLIDATVRRR